MMNWATIAPETRLYKGKNLFRWEDSPGLEHHCGVCATPLHNSRAKTSCIGKHVEPCYRFHQQLHFVGKSHECFGCNSSDECHHARHKEILRLIRQITALDKAAVLDTANRLLFSKSKRPENVSPSIADTSSESQLTEETEGGEETTMTRRERKKQKKSGNNSVKNRDGMEVFPQEQLDFVSEAIHLTVHESKGAWEGMYNYDHKQPEKETADEETQYEADVDGLTSNVLDLAVKSPSEMTPRQRKVQKKFSSSIDHSSFSGGSRKYGSPKADPFDGVDPEIFVRLGVEIANPRDDSKARKDIAARLVAAVKEDINIIKREADDTVMREEGFWRWAGKTAYYHISETRVDFDWATGQKRGPTKSDDSESSMQHEEAEIDDRPIPPAPDPDPDATPKPPQFDELQGFTTIMPKKAIPEATKTRSTITVQTGRSKRMLNRPLEFFPPPPSESDEEKGTEDLKEMIRRQQQKASGSGIIGGWSEPKYPFVSKRGYGKK